MRVGEYPAPLAIDKEPGSGPAAGLAFDEGILGGGVDLHGVAVGFREGVLRLDVGAGHRRGEADADGRAEQDRERLARRRMAGRNPGCRFIASLIGAS
jgi:hypothetical protein